MAIETVTITVTEAQAKAIRILARSSAKLSASELADNLFSQVVRGRFKASVEKAAEIAEGKWKTAADIMGEDKMPCPLVEYRNKYVAEYADVLKDL